MSPWTPWDPHGPLDVPLDVLRLLHVPPDLLRPIEDSLFLLHPHLWSTIKYQLDDLSGPFGLVVMVVAMGQLLKANFIINLQI